jgi:hypothetical protein
VLVPGLAASVLIPAGWLLASAYSAYALLFSVALYFAFGAFSVSASIAASRLLFNSVIPVEKNTAYTAVYYAWAGLTGGVGPLLGGRLLAGLAGWQVELGGFVLDAYRLLFVISLAGFVGSLILYMRVKADA